MSAFFGKQPQVVENVLNLFVEVTSNNATFSLHATAFAKLSQIFEGYDNM
jgi:hypothetical protein